MSHQTPDDPQTGDAPAGDDAVTRGTLADWQQLDDDPRAWSRLVDRLASQLRVLARFRMTPAARSVCEPDDLVQDVLGELVRHRERFVYDGPGSLLRWSAGILRNRIADVGRRGVRVPVPESRLAAGPVDPGGSVPTGLVDALQASVSGASHVARRHETEERVAEVLAGLPDDQREVLLLKLYEECTGREMAERLGVHESTVSVRVKRALETCARRLREPRA